MTQTETVDAEQLAVREPGFGAESDGWLDEVPEARGGGRRPPAMIEVPSVRAAKRRIALVTIWVPTLGAVAALALALTQGVSLLDIGIFVGMYVLTMMGVEVGLHRLFAHKAFKVGTGLRMFLGVAASMAAQGPVSYWAATHRRHHIYSDTPEDPHSPHVRKHDDGSADRMSTLRGLWHSQIGNMYTDHATNVAAFAKDLLRDEQVQLLDRTYRVWVLVGLALPALVGGALTGTAMGALTAFLWGGLVRIFVVHHVYFANGSFSHMYGARPYDTGDESTNNYVFGVPTFGSAWQNNHHAFPASAVLGLRWYEPDVGAVFIRAFEILGLAWDVRRPPPPAVRARKARVRGEKR